MANQKSVVDLPRFLLPKLTWTKASVKGAASQITPPRHPHKRPRIPSFQQPLPQPTFQGPILSSRSYCSLTQNESSHTSYGAILQPQSTDTAPIRHNGVYVAAYKPARRAFSASAIQQKDHHFDTLKFVQRLKGESFSEEQAVAMMRVLNDVIEESIQNLTRTMILKEGEHGSTLQGGAKLRRDSAADFATVQTPNEAHIHKRLISRNCGPN